MPESAKARKAHAAVLFEADPSHPEAVISEAERALAIRPDYLQARADLGGYYVAQGDRIASAALADARGWYERAVAVLEGGRPLAAQATARYTEKMLARGHVRQAIPDVGDPTLWTNLSLAYLRLDR